MRDSSPSAENDIYLRLFRYSLQVVEERGGGSIDLNCLNDLNAQLR
jgi:hypothetical protein